MSKSVRRKKRSEVSAAKSPERNGLSAVVAETREALKELVLASGLRVFQELLEEDRESLCGPRYQRGEDRKAYRHGHDRGRLVLGGRQVIVRRPRVRSVDGEELMIPTWESMRDHDPLDERAVEQMMCGVSTRRYERSLEPVPEEMSPHGTSKSAVSRRFVAMTKGKVEDYLERPLDELDLAVLLLDGASVRDHLYIVAVGIDTQGQKHVLGLVEGPTESAEVCRSLLRDLIGRGLAVERPRLVVIDGGKGLRKAVKTTFGKWVLVQRCRIHKMRNVCEHLPKSRRAWFKAQLRKAWKIEDAEKARAALLSLARSLEEEHPSSARSLREGLEETLTVNRLGLRGALLQTLRSTNVIENLQGSIKHTMRNVKRWRNGAMVIRWVGTALYEAEQKFRRVRGYRDLSALDRELHRLLRESELDRSQESKVA